MIKFTVKGDHRIKPYSDTIGPRALPPKRKGKNKMKLLKDIFFAVPLLALAVLMVLVASLNAHMTLLWLGCALLMAWVLLGVLYFTDWRNRDENNN